MTTNGNSAINKAVSEVGELRGVIGGGKDLKTGFPTTLTVFKRSSLGGLVLGKSSWARALERRRLATLAFYG